MANDYENMARMLMSSPQGSKIMKGLDQLSALSATPSGQQLIAMLAGGGGDALKVAAQAAAQSPDDKARVLLNSLFSTKDGAALAAKIIELTGV